ncbi:OLC1v1018948C1 [Oldenlandia corymbosa var. corymbosa]|uniref:OLC1v1018948C1 n=1 Tax=Oldenlandia corymbosa var. corymbosa TaxID=529605 RepID=A0AAV1ECT6_OLDCO|nr:OLC1v1018948C1 [Oldenlandia corymbosa var. corymbosa]
MKMLMRTFLFLSLLTTVAFTTEASVVDFCVADLSLPNGPAGFSCKNPSQVVAEDFFYSLATKGNTNNVFRTGVTLAFAPDFAGVNGLGISLARVDIEGLLHFQYNIGKIPAVLYVSFGSDNPGIQVLDFALFLNDLPTPIVANTTLLAIREVKRLKKLFGGTN